MIDTLAWDAESLTDLLGRAGRVESIRPDTWRAALDDSNGVMIRWREDCLELAAEPLDAPPDAPPSQWLHAMLEVNGRLPGGAKLGLSRRSRRPVVVAEIMPGEDAADLPFRFDDALVGVRAAVEWFGELASLIARGPRAGDKAERPTPAASGKGDGEAARLGECCAAAGWPAVERDGGRWGVALETRDGFGEAIVAAGKSGGFEALAVLDAAPETPEARHAVAALLLCANRHVRLARAIALPGEAAPRYAWQAVDPVAPTPEAMGHALAALSVAWRLTAAEAGALCDPAAATWYLRLRGWC